jgi:fatty acid synthase
LSAEYLTNNLLNEVHFEEASRHIPVNAIAIEIAPHGLLQTLLEKSLNKGITNIALTQRDHPACSEWLLSALGRCVYSQNLEIKFQVIMVNDSNKI